MRRLCGRGATGRTLPPAPQACSSGTGRAPLTPADPHLQERRNPEARWLPAEAVVRGNGTRVTRGAGLSGARGPWTLIRGSSLRAPGLRALPGGGPGPLALARSSLAGALVPQSYTQIVACGGLLGPKLFFVQRQPGAGGRGQA